MTTDPLPCAALLGLCVFQRGHNGPHALPDPKETSNICLHDGIEDASDCPKAIDLATDPGYLYSVRAMGVVTLSEGGPPDQRGVQIAALDNLLDLINAAGGVEWFVDHYGNLGIEVEYLGQVEL